MSTNVCAAAKSAATAIPASKSVVGDDAVFLDPQARTIIARGNPRELRDHCEDERVRGFLTRGRK